MSNLPQNFNAGQAHGRTEAKAEEWFDSAKNSASAAADKANDAAYSAGQQAQLHKEEEASFFQQTGEQMKNMAQGAVNSVKHTLGMDKK